MMFRLKASGLPDDFHFPQDFKQLGYFINEDDEIRSIEDDRYYFHYFIDKNTRLNDCQRYAFNACSRSEVLSRLQEVGMRPVLLPLGMTPKEPHIPILVSDNIGSAGRVIILFYEQNQDLGILAHRTVGGHGGINAGSCVDLVKEIRSRRVGSTVDKSPAIILANMGELRWCRKLHEAVTHDRWYGMPRKSAVHHPPRFDPNANTVEGNRTTAEHVAYVLDKVVPALCKENVYLDIIGVGYGADESIMYIHDHFEDIGHKISAIAMCAPVHNESVFTNAWFKKWLEERGRSYLLSEEPANLPLAGPHGGRLLPALGCNSYSIGEPHVAELMLVKGHKVILDWFDEVHACDDDDGVHYVNPTIIVMETEDPSIADLERPYDADADVPGKWGAAQNGDSV